MLVLTRREGEQIKIRIGTTEVTVEVLESKNHRARLGLTAPSDVTILRSEVLDRDEKLLDTPVG